MDVWALTFFAPEWGAAGASWTAALDAVDLSGLDSTTAQARLVPTPAVLVAQQNIHPALGPLCGLPAVAEDTGGQQDLRLEDKHAAANSSPTCWNITIIIIVIISSINSSSVLGYCSKCSGG